MVDNVVEFEVDVEKKYVDKYGVKNKLRNRTFDNHDDLECVLKAYEISNIQHTRDLTILRSLENKISIFDHQIMAAKIVKNDFGGRALLSDEVGLGKTIEAGILLKEYFTTGLVQKALILTPPSLVSQWKDELITKFDLDFIAQKYDGRFTGIDQHRMLIASLASASRITNAERLNKIDWDIVVVDEAHRLRNEQTDAHKFVRDLPKKFLLLLSATPVQNNLHELYNMVEIVRPGLLSSWSDFAATYTNDKSFRTVNPITRDELQGRLSQVMIRTRRSEVRKYISFTDRIPNTHLLEYSQVERQLYDDSTKFIRGQWDKLHESNSMAAIFSLMTLQRQVSSSSAATRIALKRRKSDGEENHQIEKLIILSDKIDVDTKMKKLQDIINNDPSTKYLIFTEFIATQDYIFDTLETDGFEAVKFNGTMSTSDRDLSVSKFKHDIQIMVSTEAGGEGQNFQFCSNVINYDLPWNPMRVEQRIGRVHRIGQKNDVNIHNFAIKNTIEEYVLTLLYEKMNLFKMTIGDMDLIFGDNVEVLGTKLFESYMTSSNETEIKNKLSALGDEWSRDKKKLEETVREFDTEVFKNFDLSSLRGSS